MEEEPEGPSYPKPWYYRPEFMIPMFIFWPSGAILAIRSPWNSNVMFGGLAWAFIFVFGVLGVRRSEEHTSELQSRTNLVCRLLLEKKKNI